MRTATRHLTDSELLLFIDRQLSPNRHADADSHLVHCTGCRTRRAQFERTTEDVAAAWRAEGLVRAAGDYGMRARLLRRMRAADAEWDASWRFLLRSSAARTPRWLRAGAAVAAMVLLVRIMPLVRLPAEPPAAFEADALPIASLTPGAVWSVSVTELCDGGAREQRDVSDEVRRDVLRRYRMDRVPPAEYELDYLITPELGGAADARNLWPQRYRSRVWNAHVKDQLERLLPSLVCRGEMDLAAAQREIAGDWIAAYKKHFHTSSPIHMKAGMIGEGDASGTEAERMTYPLWRGAGAPPVRLISFSASGRLAAAQ